MKIIKNTLIFIFISVLIGSLLVGCSSSTSSTTSAAAASTSQAQVTGSTTAQESTTKVNNNIPDYLKGLSGTLKVAITPDTAGKGMRAKAKEFQDLTGVTVEYNEVGFETYYQQAPITIQSEKYTYDVMEFWEGAMQEFGPVGLLMPLEDKIGDLLKDVQPALVKSATKGGHVYGIPILPSWMIMFYNKDILSKAGLDPEKPPRTWDEFLAACKKVTKDGTYGFTTSWEQSYGASFSFLNWQKSAGGTQYTWDNGKLNFHFDSPESKKALEFMKTIYDSGVLAPGVVTQTQQDVTALFASGQVAFLHMWDMYSAYLNDPANSKIIGKIGWMAFPGIDANKSAALNGHGIIGIPSSAKNVDAAVAFIKFVASKENTKRRSLEEFTNPVYVEQYSDPEIMKAIPYATVLSEVMKFDIDQFPPIKNSFDLNATTGQEIQKMLTSGQSIDDTLKNIQAKAQSMQSIKEMAPKQ